MRERIPHPENLLDSEPLNGKPTRPTLREYIVFFFFLLLSTVVEIMLRSWKIVETGNI